VRENRTHGSEGGEDGVLSYPYFIGAEAVLQLRALYCSGDLELYLQFHFEQEKIRNYAGLQAANGEFKMAA
jgi:hypothetical protein